MKKGGIIIIAIVAILAIIGFWGVSIYNSIIPKHENVKKHWSNVESAYQKRADLIPNLVSTVKGAANFEQETLTGVIEARAKATSTEIKVDPNNLTPENIAKFQQAQDGLSSTLSRLLVSVERYPELKANQNFLSLQAELSSIESEVQFERKKFNDAAADYNGYILKAPKNLIANIVGFKEKGYFTAQAGTENAPKVEF